jgi:DNA-binding MarR family transcriptional regulator
MADIISPVPTRLPSEPSAPARVAPGCSEPVYDLIELLFFAYRDFVRDPDTILGPYGFGRAHHRVLHFVNRHPGLKVTELLDILKITKQSLGRVLRDLVEQGFVESRAGTSDRRQRLLFVTPTGARLAGDLAEVQSTRVEKALERLGPDGHDMAMTFLLGMVDEGERAAVTARVFAMTNTSRNIT